MARQQRSPEPGDIFRNGEEVLVCRHPSPPLHSLGSFAPLDGRGFEVSYRDERWLHQADWWGSLDWICDGLVALCRTGPSFEDEVAQRNLRTEVERLRAFAADVHKLLGRGTHGTAEADFRCAISGLGDVLQASRENSAEAARFEQEAEELRAEVLRLTAQRNDQDATPLAAERDALLGRIARMRRSCPSHEAVLIAPDEGCWLCATSAKNQ